MPDTLKVGATDVSSLAVITDFSGVMSAGAPDAAPVVLPFRRGGYFVAGEMHPYSWDLPLAVVAESRGAVHDALAVLAALFDTATAPLALTRVVTNGSSGTAEHTSSAMVTSGWQPVYLGEKAARLPLTLVNLDGVWYGAAVTETGITTSDTVTLPGSLATSRITLTLSGDAGPQTVAVTETGTSVTFTGATDVDPAVIDVQSMTATRDGVDVSGLLSHAGAAQGLLLRPGANTVTLTGGGSVDLTAYGAVR